MIVYEGDFETEARKDKLGTGCENERKGLHGVVFTSDRQDVSSVFVGTEYPGSSNTVPGLGNGITFRRSQ